MRQVVSTAAVLAAYLLLSLTLFGSTGSWSARYVAVGVADPELFMWFLNWWPFAILHGLNPFWTHFVWYPRGFDTVWATSVPTLAIAAAPVTLVAGPTASYNVLTLLGPTLNGWCGFLLVRSLTQDVSASFVAGLLYGFSSYVLGQMIGHLNLDVIFLVPLIVLLIVKRIRQEVLLGIFIPLLSVMLVLELGISEEVFASLCVLGTLVWVTFLLVVARTERSMLCRLGAEIVVAAILAAIAASPFLYYVIIGMAGVPGVINSPTNFSADPVNWILPTQVTWLGHDILPGIATRILGGITEQGGYLGAALILVLVLYAWESRNNRYARGLILSIAILVLCSLGPWLHLDGTRTRIPLPWIVFTHLPLIKSALPIRFTMYVSLGAAIAAGCWISAGRGNWRIVRLTLAATAYLCLLPNPALFKWSNMPADGLFQNPHWSDVVLHGANVVILPFAQNGPDMSWQLDAKMQFMQSGGYVGYPPLGEWAEPIVRDFFTGDVGNNFSHDIVDYCRSHRVDDIIISPGTPPDLAKAIQGMGWPTVRLEGNEIVTVPHR